MQDLLPGERPKPKSGYGKHVQDPASDMDIFKDHAVLPKCKHGWPLDTPDRVKMPVAKWKTLMLDGDTTADQPTGDSIDSEGDHFRQPPKVQ